MSPRLLPAALAVLAAAGCMETTRQPVDRHIMTADEVAQSDERLKEKKAADAKATAEAAKAPPAPPPGSREELEQLLATSEKEPSDPKWHFLIGRIYEHQNPPKLELAELRYRR